MTRTTFSTHRQTASRHLRRITCTFILLVTGGITARAQDDYPTTPLAIAPGSPAGSYSLSDIDTVNLFNGSVSVYIPLTNVSGRGGARNSVGMAWNSPTRWQVVKSYDAYGGAVYGPQPAYRGNLSGSIRYGDWGAYFTRSADVINPCLPHDPGIYYAQRTLSRLHVVEPDGTEHEMRDTATGGVSLTNGGCYSQGPSRGREFVSTDGSGITMLFDDVVRDVVMMDMGEVSGGGSGAWLLLPDGRRFRITANNLTMRDRNGNMTSWENFWGAYTPGEMTFYPWTGGAVKDSLGRKVVPGDDPSVTPCVERGGDPQGTCGYFSYKGFGGAERRVYFGTNAAYLVTGVFLPDGLSYRFHYNQYDDLIRIDLPTGGSIEYEYGPGLDGPQPEMSGWMNNVIPGTYHGGPGDFHVYRRVTERRLYKEGHVLVNRQTFSKPEHTQTGNAGFVEKKVYDSDGATLLSSEKHYFHGGANETFSIWQPFAYTPWKIGREYRTEFYDAVGNLLKRVEQMWEQRAPVGWWTGNPDEAPSNDPRVSQITTTLDNGLVSTTTFGYDPNVPYNSQTDVFEYDYGVGSPGPLLRRSHTDYVTAASYTSALTGAYIRDLPLHQWVSTDVSGQNKVSHTSYGYDEFALAGAPNITGHDAAYTTAKTVRGNVTSVTRYANASGLTGAVTGTMHYDIAGNVISSTDALGNTTHTSYADSFCNDGGVRCAGTFIPHTYAFPTSATSSVPDVSTTYGQPAGTFSSTSALVSATVYDFYTGLVYSTTDPNNQTTRMEYVDPLDRPTAQVRPGATGGRTDIEYAPDGRSVRVLSDLDATRRLESYQYFDGLGRAVRSQQYENADPAKPWITRDTEYDALGRAKRVSFPYRWTAGTASPFSANRWKEMIYDALGRVRAVTTRPDGAVAITDYSGDRVLVKDPAGKERVSRSDALGRLMEVWEVTPAETGPGASTVALAPFPNHPEASHGYLTSYKYDALGNLRMVEQAGQHLGQAVTQRRFFAYDSLGRLLRVKHPEQGSIAADADFPALTDSASGVSNSQWSVGYAYDANGNMVKRKEARTATLGVTTNYAYDRLNRNIITAYTTPAGSGAAATPEVRRFYDGAANRLGRLRRSEAVGVSASEIVSYDATGRPTQYRQSFWVNDAWGPDYVVHLSHNKAGLITSQTYPSGHAVAYNYDAAGRPGDSGGQAAFSGNLGDGVARAYASNIRYHELGGMEQERFGTQTPVYNKGLYNGRGQLAEIRVSTHSITSAGHETDWNRGAIINHYSASGWGASGGGPDNNGNLLRQEVYIPNTDDVNAGYVNFVQYYGYDALNRLTSVEDKPFNGAPDFYQSYTYDRWGNRAVSPNSWNTPEPQFSLDAATNRLGVPAGQAGAMNYDAAGNLVNDSHAGYGSPTGQQTRFYDAEGRMTSAQTGTGLTATYTYDADGRRVKRNAGAAGEVWQVYGLGGELLAEYAANASPTQPQKEYGYRGGKLLVTAEAGAQGAKLPISAVTASLAWGSFTPEKGADGDPSTAWIAGGGAPQWLQLDLGQASSVSKVRLLVNQDPPGNTTHQVYGGPTPDSLTLLGTLSGYTQSGQWLELPASAQGVRYVRVTTTGSPSWVAWSEVEVYGGDASAPSVGWLVADQLGTPRMVIDQTGSLAGVRRHDYLPFGEDVPADANWRTQGRGYVGDTVRQKFTGYERDAETGLDYAQARYFASAQGRFTGVDPLLASGRTGVPQTWNRYTYALNNPLRLTDPTGMDPLYTVPPDNDQHKTGRPIAPPMPVIPTPDLPPPLAPVAPQTGAPSAAGPTVPDDGTTAPMMVPIESAKLFADKALGMPTCQFLFSGSGTNGRAHFRELSLAGKIKVADASVMMTLPDGRTIRFVDSPIGGTVVGGTIYLNPNNPIVNGTAEGYGEPGAPTHAQALGGLMIHEQLHITGDFPREMGMTMHEVMQKSASNDLMVHTMCVGPAARRRR